MIKKINSNIIYIMNNISKYTIKKREKEERINQLNSTFWKLNLIFSKIK